MSTRTPDRLVNVMSQWLARHVSDGELKHELDEADRSGLSAAHGEALDELDAELRSPRGRGELERAVRETLEALALG